jgi:hypothetical protein
MRKKQLSKHCITIASNQTTASEFIPKFEEYLSKYFALNTVPNKVEIVNRWNDQRKAELNRTGTDLVIKIKFDKFKSAWLEAFRPF